MKKKANELGHQRQTEKAGSKRKDDPIFTKEVKNTTVNENLQTTETTLAHTNKTAKNKSDPSVGERLKKNKKKKQKIKKIPKKRSKVIFKPVQSHESNRKSQTKSFIFTQNEHSLAIVEEDIQMQGKFNSKNQN